MKQMTVEPHYFRGFNMSVMQLFGSGPKFTITCGNCRATFQKRIPISHRPGVSCPECNCINVLPLTEAQCTAQKDGGRE